MRLASRIAPVVAATLLAACGSARKLDALTGGGACVGCHGGGENGSGAPPSDTHGRSDPTLPSVGAHTGHVDAGIDCGACHVKPETLDTPGHIDGQVTITWSALATANGTLAPRFDEGAATCANVYCHGYFRGGSKATPRWTRVADADGASGAGGWGDVGCGSCHGIPPPRSTNHPQRTDCGACHAGYTSSSVNRATHVNGTVEFLSLTCASCHGDRTRAATPTNPQLAAAPPLDTSGNTATTAPGVGAHQAHLTDGALRRAMPCTECHVVPASLDGHPTGTTVLAWDPQLAATRGAAPSYQDGRCASTYCHGATLGAGGSNHAPLWTGGPAEASCGTCHGFPPPAPHVQNTDCGRCHPGYGFSTVNLATHVNGRVELVALTCTTCHGDASRDGTAANPLYAAPPMDTHGAQASSRVGAHQAHLQGGALSAPLACDACHAVPASLDGHPTGAVALPWGALAKGELTASVNANGAFSAFSTTQPTYAGGTCSATYCHGTYSGVFTYPVLASDPVEWTSVTYSGGGGAPSWGGAAPCGSCHGIPPASNGWHNASHAAAFFGAGGHDCALCHPDATGTSAADAVVTDPARHADGKIDLEPRFQSRCYYCH